MSEKNNFYSLDNILKKNALYNVIIGERSNGKTFAVGEKALKDFAEQGQQLGLIRRWDVDFIGKRGQTTFDALVNEGKVKKYFGDKWNNISYYSSRWYLSKVDRELNKRVLDDIPFCYGFALNTAEHDKSTSYPNIKNILFDEFLSRNGYLPEEFVIFQNVLSTIIRHRDDVKIFMCGNTVNKYAPYFKEMGLTNIEKMKQGTIDVYTYGNSELTVAVEFSDTPQKKKKSDKYFAFDNPQLQMITRGAWEIALYPHLPEKYTDKDVLFTYFIEFEDNMLQCEIIRKGHNFFTYIHRKTSKLKFPDKDIFFTQNYAINRNFIRKITKPKLEIHRKILSFFEKDKVFYQDNDVGEIVRNYIQWCKNN